VIGAVASQVQRVADAAARYGLQLHRSNVTGDERTTLHALALARLCETVGGVAGCDAFDQIADGAPEPNWLAGDLCTGLVAATGAVLHRSRCSKAAMTYLGLLSDIGTAEASVSNQALLALATSRRKAADPLSAEVSDVDLSQGFHAGALEAALAEIEAVSRFGLVAIHSEPPLPQKLEGAALAAFRCYDLPLGMRCLRARRYIASGWSLGLQVGLDFVLSSQGSDGGFGDYDTAIAELIAKGELAAEPMLRLPVTFQAVWTVADLIAPGFRFATALFDHGAVASDRAVAS